MLRSFIDHCEIIIDGKICVLISHEDSDLQNTDWCVSQGYVKKSVNRKTMVMHRVILERKLGRKLNLCELTDHANLNTLDNQRCNLRLSTKQMNSVNRKNNANNTSGYRGVHFCKSKNRRKRWVAEIKVNRQKIVLGYFDSPKEAYEKYVEAAHKYFGEFANNIG